MNPPPGKSMTSSVALARASAVPEKKSIALTVGRDAREEVEGRGMERCFTKGRLARWWNVSSRTYRAQLSAGLVRPACPLSRSKLTYGLLVFSQVVRSISTVQRALNLRS